MTFDHFILGQGIAGTLLSRQLMQEGKTVLVIDKFRAGSSSNVAAGVITPVAGMRYVPQNTKYLFEAYKTYSELSEEIGAPLINIQNIIRFEEIPEERIQKLEAFNHFSVRNEDVSKWEIFFKHDSPMTNISPAWIIDMRTLLSKWRTHLEDNKSLLDEEFSWEYFHVDRESASYKEHRAGSIICCEGSNISHNPYFKDEAFVLNKGQALILSIPELLRQNIYLKNIKLIPWQDKDLFWAGTSFEIEFENADPTPDFRAFMEKELNSWLRLPYQILDHMASIRVTTKAYQPIMKEHAQFPQIKIFNGLGSKGCTTAPYYVKQFVQELIAKDKV